MAVTINLDETMPLEKAIRKFTKAVKREGIMDKVKEKQYFEKPSAKRHRDKVSQERRQLRARVDEKRNGKPKEEDRKFSE